MYVYTEIQKYNLGQHKFVWRVFPFFYWCQIRQRRFLMKRKSGARPRQGLLPSWCWGQCLCLFWYLCWYWCWIYLVNCPTRQFLLLFIGSLHCWLSSWQWCRLYWPLRRPEMGDLSRNFFCKSHKLHVFRWRISLLSSCIWCISP